MSANSELSLNCRYLSVLHISTLKYFSNISNITRLSRTLYFPFIRKNILTSCLPCLGKCLHHLPCYPNLKSNSYSWSLPFSPSYSFFIRYILLILPPEYTAHLSTHFSLPCHQDDLASSTPIWNSTTGLSASTLPISNTFSIKQKWSSLKWIESSYSTP